MFGEATKMAIGMAVDALWETYDVDGSGVMTEEHSLNIIHDALAKVKMESMSE